MRGLFLLLTHPDQSWARLANLTGDSASIEDGFGGEVGPVGRQRVDVDGVAALVPPEEALPERRQRQRAAREEHEGQLGHTPEWVPPHPRAERRTPEQVLVRHRVIQSLRRHSVGGSGSRGGSASKPWPEQLNRRRVPVPRHEHASHGQPQAEQQEHLEHPPLERPMLPLPRLLHVVLHGATVAAKPGRRDSGAARPGGGCVSHSRRETASAARSGGACVHCGWKETASARVRGRLRALRPEGDTDRGAFRRGQRRWRHGGRAGALLPEGGRRRLRQMRPGPTAVRRWELRPSWARGGGRRGRRSWGGSGARVGGERETSGFWSVRGRRAVSGAGGGCAGQAVVLIFVSRVQEAGRGRGVGEGRRTNYCCIIGVEITGRNGIKHSS